MEKYLILLVLLVTFAAPGCASDTKPVVEVEASPSATETAQTTETAVHSPTATIEAATETAVSTATLATAIATDNGKVTLNGVELLDIETEAPICFTDIPAEISYSPTYEYFLVIPACIEGDNLAFIFQADGTGKQEVTGAWDYLNFLNFEWAADGQSFTYQRINSCCLSPEDIPADAPPVGWVQYDVVTGEKTLIATPTPRP